MQHLFLAEETPKKVPCSKMLLSGKAFPNVLWCGPAGAGRYHVCIDIAQMKTMNFGSCVGSLNSNNLRSASRNVSSGSFKRHSQQPLLSMGPHMVPKGSLRNVRGIAQATLIGLLARMPPFVCNQVDSPCRGIAAEAALKRLLPRVESFVAFQVPRLCCSIVTVCALVWLLARVDPPMFHHQMVQRGRIWAQTAFIARAQICLHHYKASCRR